MDPIAILKELVAIPSVNPMGGEPLEGSLRESRLTAFLEEFFHGRHVQTRRQEVEPGRDNLLARIEGAPDGNSPLVVFDAHQDTVPVEGMTIPPWNPVVRDGKLFGRGSCDTKGPMAAMIAAALRLLDLPVKERPTVLLCFAVNEEFGFSGIKRLCSSTVSESGWAEGFVSRVPDAAVVGEPTNLSVITAHKGAIRWKIRTRGRAAHSSQPESGENAIYRMAGVLRRLEEYQTQVAGTLVCDPLCGSPTLSVGTIRGGMSVNVVPDECVIEVDRRIVPGEDSLAARRHVIETIGEVPGVEHEPPFLDLPPLTATINGPIAERLCKCVQSEVGRGEIRGATYGTHAAFYAQRGIPAVVFGPGSIEQAHTNDEWVSVDQVRQAADILYRFLAKMG